MKEVIKTDKMQTEKRILGIPLVTFVIIVIALCGITFYASSYASENSKILQKYESTQAELYSINRQLDKQGKRYKMCTSNLKQYEESNRDLKHSITKVNAEKNNEEKKSTECQSQVANLHQFYLNVKEHAGILKDSDKSNVEGITNTELDEVIGTLKNLKEKQEDALQKEKENTKKSEELMQAKVQEIEHHKNTISEMKEEIANVRKLLEEKEDEISNMVREKEKPGFRKKKPQPDQPNVKMIDMNKIEGGHDQKISQPKTTAPKTAAGTQSTTPVKGQQPPTTKAPENIGTSNKSKAVETTGHNKKDLTTSKPTAKPGTEKVQTINEKVQTTTATIEKKKAEEKGSKKVNDEVDEFEGEVEKSGKQIDLPSQTNEGQEEDEDFDDHLEGDEHKDINA